MATTTNYSWTTPDDTALVKNGAAAIRSLGTAIDTTVFNNASAGIAKTIVDAKGDLIAATAADTVSRLAVGTNGQYLAANSSAATGLEWQTISAGGMTLLSTTTLSGASTTISSISGSYTNLYGIIYGVTNATANGIFKMSIESSAIYSYQRIDDTKAITSATNTDVEFNSTSNVTRTDANNAYTFTINSYANTNVGRKPVNYFSYYEESTPRINLGWGVWRGGSAITSLTFSNTGGNLSTGTVLLYGVK
jgi:hypothetical protein